jgi:multidrug efflux pump subunit AcrB
VSLGLGPHDSTGLSERDVRPPGELEPEERAKRSLHGPLAWMAKNSVAANLLMIVLLVGGLLFGLKVKQEVFPEVALDMITIQVVYPGASPAEVEQGVVLAVEEAVRGIDGVKEVRANANEGMASISVELLLGTDPNKALSDVKGAVDRITSFPQDVERPIVSLAALRSQVVSLALYGDLDETTLRALGDRARDELLRDDRVTYVELGGVRPLEISIEIPQERLREYGLTLDQVAQAIRAASVEVPAGSIKTSQGEVLLRTTERRSFGSEFGDIVVLGRPDGTELRLRDLARIEDGFRETDQAATFNGKRAVLVNVFRVGNETPIDVSRAAKDYIERVRPTLPPGAAITYFNDTSELFADRIDLLLRNAALGLCLVLLVLGMFLDVRLAFWVTLGIPISFLGSLLFLPSADVSINMISLFAFIVTLGIVVDDAIVIGEAIFHRRRAGLGSLEAAVAGLRDVAAPVVFSVLTTIVAFMPLLFVPGVMGKFFRNLPIVVIIVLSLSLLESLVILPAHLAHSRSGQERGLWRAIDQLQGRISLGLERFIERFYRPVLEHSMRARYFTLAIGIALLLVAAGLVAGGRVGVTFFPRIEADTVFARLKMPFGTSVEQTERAQARLLQTAREVARELGGEERVGRGIFAQIGAHSAGGGPRQTATESGAHLSEVLFILVPSDQRDFTASEFVRRWRERVGGLPGADTLQFTYSTGAAPGAAIDIELSHTNLETLESAAARLTAELGKFAGVKDVENGFAAGKTQLDLRLRPEARALDLTESDLARQVRAAYFGSEAVRQQRGRDELRVYVRYPEAERRTLHSIETMLVRTPQGGEVPLSAAAEIHEGRSYTAIRRVDGRRIVSVRGDVEPGQANAGEVVSELMAGALPRLAADTPGLSYSLAGEQKQQGEAMSALGRGFMMALLAMFALMAIPFKSYVQPLIIMAVIPFGAVGAIGGHLLLGYDLSLMSMMGLVALSGVVVNDSLVMITAVNEARQRGAGVWEAVRAGATRRFRPILLTSLTTFLGLAPMILETSMQARFLIPMALSLGFGVLFATMITLFIVPSLYLALEDARRSLSSVTGWLGLSSGREHDPRAV